MKRSFSAGAVEKISPLHARTNIGANKETAAAVATALRSHIAHVQPIEGDQLKRIFCADAALKRYLTPLCTRDQMLM
jgi:hypothetical protein